MFGSKAKGKAAPKGPDNVEVPETFSPLERARHFGTSKLSLQRLVCVHELVDGSHEIGYEDTVIYLLPLVKQLAQDPEVLVRQTLVGHFGDLAGFLIQSDPERGYQKVVDEILPIISLLLTEKASEVRQGAADALTTLASHLRPGERGDQVLMTVIQLSHSNDDEDARSTAVQLLNSLAETLGRDLCQQFVGVELVALCEDPAFRVRKSTASNFSEVARVADDEFVLKRLMDAFARLVHDQHWGVRKAAAESLVGLAMSLKVDSREGPCVPLMNDLLKDNSRWVRMSALQQLGYFIAALESPQRVPPDLLTQYVEIIEQTKANPDAADISYHCAYTFGAVTRTMGKECWSRLQTPFTSLCKDTQLKTRKAMAASVHIVAQTLGSDLCDQEVMPQFEALMQDSSDEVRMSALKNVSAVLRVLAKLAPQKRVLKTLQGTMSKADTWRLRHLVASQIGPMCEALGRPAAAEDSGAGDDGNTDLVTSVLVPLLLQLCQDGVAEVRDEAARSTARALRAAAPELFTDPSAPGTEGSSGCSSSHRAPLPVQTTRLVRHLITNFARGNTFWKRMVYIRMCDSVIRDSPPQSVGIFTDHLLRPLVRLVGDTVKNVRLCWATTLVPHLRRMGRLGQCPQLIAAAAKMMKEDACVEVRRVLSGAQIAELPEGADASLGPESDVDESDKEGSYFATEGGTGDSSECSDAGVGEDEHAESRDLPGSPAGSDLRSAGSAADSSPEASSSSPTDVAAEPAAARSPKAVPAVPPLSPSASPSSPTAPGFDPVEDGLVAQGEVEKDLDERFADRRLFHEAEDEPGFPAASSLTAALPPLPQQAAAEEPAKEASQPTAEPSVAAVATSTESTASAEPAAAAELASPAEPAIPEEPTAAESPAAAAPDELAASEESAAPAEAVDAIETAPAEVAEAPAETEAAEADAAPALQSGSADPATTTDAAEQASSDAPRESEEEKEKGAH